MAISLGVDIGGTGMKAALVDTLTGNLLSDRYRLLTPPGAKPNDIADVYRDIIHHFDWSDKPVGIGFPAVIDRGICITAVNIDNSWIGINVEDLFSTNSNSKCSVVNDADAAALGELSFGCGKGKTGKLLMITLGTGIGSGLVSDGKLIPNLELGKLPFKDKTAEDYVSNKTRKVKDLSWQEWGSLLDDYLTTVNEMIRPDLIVIGGGVSKKWEKFQDYVSLSHVCPAKLGNNAGILGAALAN